MKTLILASMILVGAAAASRAENSAVMTDPLTMEIRRNQVTQPNGGVTGFRMDPSGKVIKIEAVELGAQPIGGAAPAPAAKGTLDGLKTHKGLLTEASAKTVKKGPIREPKAQLHHIEGAPLRKW